MRTEAGLRPSILASTVAGAPSVTRLLRSGPQQYTVITPNGAQLNLPPVCDADGPYLAECAGATTSVTLGGTGSSDPNGDPLTYSWTGPFLGGTATGPTPTVQFPGTGTFLVTLAVSDGLSTTTCSAPVTIGDTIAPDLSLSVSPSRPTSTPL